MHHTTSRELTKGLPPVLHPFIRRSLIRANDTGLITTIRCGDPNDPDFIIVAPNAEALRTLTADLRTGAQKLLTRSQHISVDLDMIADDPALIAAILEARKPARKPDASPPTPSPASAQATATRTSPAAHTDEPAA